MTGISNENRSESDHKSIILFFDSLSLFQSSLPLNSQSISEIANIYHGILWQVKQDRVLERVGHIVLWNIAV